MWSANELLAPSLSTAAARRQAARAPSRPPGEPIKSHNTEKHSRNAPLNLVGGLLNNGTCLSLQPGSLSLPLQAFPKGLGSE